MTVVHEAARAVVRPLRECELESFVVIIRGVVEKKCVLLLVSYCRDVFRGRDKSAVRHGIAVERPCARSMVAGEYIISGRIASKRSLKNSPTMKMR